MLDIQRIDKPADFPDSLSRADFVDFLFVHLDQFGDSKQAINNSIDYAFSEAEGNGGFLLAAYDGDELVGAAVINRTGMKEFIPANILVYVAVDGSKRGKGYGGSIVSYIQEQCTDGGLALHVEYDNPAKRLYERLGFTSKYAEMRYTPPSADNKA